MRIRLKAKGNDDDQIGEIIERRDDGRITIRFYNGRLPEWIKSAWRPGLHQWGR